MAYYPNQQQIILGHAKDIKHYKGDPDGFVDCPKNGPRREAMRLLSGNGYKLYDNLLMWDGVKVYDFSPAGIAKETGMSDEGARRAKRELQEKGFIITNDDGKLEFFPISRTSVSRQKI